MATSHPKTVVIVKTPSSDQPGKAGGLGSCYVAVSVPGHIDPETVQVNFARTRSDVWMPADLWPGSAEVRHQ